MKQIKYIIFAFLLSLTFILKVNAFSITGVTSTTVGSSIAVKIEASGLTGRFDVSTSNSSVLSGGKSIWLENNSTTLYFSANKVGNASVTVNATDVSDENGNTFTGKRILYITVKDKSTSTTNKKPSVEVNKKYSSNNYLKTLNIEGYSLEPVFNKNTLEYNVTLDIDTELIKINAECEDSKANSKGIGEVKVNAGTNEINVIVTAENGNERIYKINATVLEPDPIEVEIDGKTYTVVRKKGQVENIPVGFSESTVKIKDQDIASYISEVAKLTLVGLKDKEGNISLFIYDEKNNKYTAFEELKGSSINLLVLDNNKKAPNGFEKTSFRYNDISIDGYKLKDDKKDNYYLVYAKNLETGSEDFYLYDKKDNTFQRFFEDIIKQKDKKLKYLFYISSGFLVLFILILIFKIFKSLFTSKQRKIRKYEKKIKKLKAKLGIYEDDDSYDISSVDESPEIKQVDEDEYIVPKKSRKQKLREIEEAKRKLDSSKPSYRRVSLEDDEE